MATSVEVRMYNMGFGDAFRVTVRDGTDVWRMLVDCGAHAHGQARPVAESVADIVADLEGDCGADGPFLDVVVGTHHHRDHIVGFANDAWRKVRVGEVWVPFIEDATDDDAKSLRQGHAVAAKKLHALIGARRSALGADTVEGRKLYGALMFAENSGGNPDNASQNGKATDRLLGRNNTTFANTPVRVRYLPDRSEDANTIDMGKCGVVAHILGPPRDPAMLKKMDPPAKAGWLTLNLDDPDSLPSDAASRALFNQAYVIDDDAVTDELRSAVAEFDLTELNNDDALLAAAALLEQATNNTSVFFVLDIRGMRFLFPGDAQQGAWDHVLDDPKAFALIEAVDFYKVGHHGSHNATPKTYVVDVWQGAGDAMVPWGLVKRWKDTIPKHELIQALTDHDHRVIIPRTWPASDDGDGAPAGTVGTAEILPGAGSPHAAKEVKQGKWWSELTFTVAD